MKREEQDRRGNQALRDRAAAHLRRARRLRELAPDLAREHQLLAKLYKRHVELAERRFRF